MMSTTNFLGGGGGGRGERGGLWLEGANAPPPKTLIVKCVWVGGCVYLYQHKITPYC